MDISPAQLEGPRLIRREELIDSIRLTRLCFGGPEEIENKEQILAEYVSPRRGGVYALLDKGRPVSQIGIVHDQLKVYDGKIRTGSIGGVCTHPDYRRRGVAGRVLEHCTQQLLKEGARLMLISGDGGLYTRFGNVLHGKYHYFSLRPGQSDPGRSTPADLLLRRATRADALTCSQLYQAEPVHFVRQISRFSAALQEPISDSYIHADSWIVERGGQAVAYMFLGVPYEVAREAGVRHVPEYAGSRLALVEALPALMSAGALQELILPVAWQEVELLQWMRDRGHSGRVTNLDGHTLRIIDFPGLMKDLRPFLLARLEKKLLRGLRFEQKGPLLGGSGEDRYTIARGTDRLELDGAAMTLLVMGNADLQAEAVRAPGALADVITALFPLPSFLPGLNYY
jgi:GNAT superfamily N-acetyltransferase